MPNVAAILDAALAIGKQSESIELAMAAQRMDWARDHPQQLPIELAR